MDGGGYVPSTPKKRADSPTEVKLAIAMYTLQLQSCIELADETSSALGSHMSGMPMDQVKVRHGLALYTKGFELGSCFEQKIKCFLITARLTWGCLYLHVLCSIVP